MLGAVMGTIQVADLSFCSFLGFVVFPTLILMLVLTWIPTQIPTPTVVLILTPTPAPVAAPARILTSLHALFSVHVRHRHVFVIVCRPATVTVTATVTVIETAYVTAVVPAEIAATPPLVKPSTATPLMSTMLRREDFVSADYVAVAVSADVDIDSGTVVAVHARAVHDNKPAKSSPSVMLMMIMVIAELPVVVVMAPTKAQIPADSPGRLSIPREHRLLDLETFVGKEVTIRGCSGFV